MLKKKIFTPGPTQVHPDVLKATISSDTYHRSPAFKAFHGELSAKLKHIFQTAQNLNILTTSGIQYCHYNFKRRFFFCRMHTGGDTTAVINNRDRIILIDSK